MAARRRDGIGPGETRRGQLISMHCAGVRSDPQFSGAEHTANLNVLTAEYYDRWQPIVIEERLLVDLLITADWQLRRLKARRKRLPPEPA